VVVTIQVHEEVTASIPVLRKRERGAKLIKKADLTAVFACDEAQSLLNGRDVKVTKSG
jgi:hypothetical protein